jgi:hypothetical protein
MKNTLLFGSLLAWVASSLVTPRTAFCDNGPGPGAKSVDTLLREWGEDVKYGVWYDRENEQYKTLRQMGSAAVPGPERVSRLVTTRPGTDLGRRCVQPTLIS